MRQKRRIHSQKNMIRHIMVEFHGLSTARSAIWDTDTTSNQSRVRGARVTDKNFREATLKRYGIAVDESVTSLWRRGPYQYFNTIQPPDDVTSKEDVEVWYHNKYKCEDSRVWLALDMIGAESIAHAYSQMLAAEEEEAKFQFHALSHFFLQDEVNVPRSPERKRIAYYKMQWAPKPDGRLLRCPPEVEHNPSDAYSSFGFNTNPDCTFWLTALQFNPRYREDVSDVTFVVSKPQVMTPYFTIEFKKSDTTLEAAVNQLAAAAGLTLYNRVALRAWRLRDTAPDRPLTAKDFEGILHYGIAFAGAKALIYEISPTLRDLASPVLVGGTRGNQPSETDLARFWAGCRISKLTRLNATEATDVLELKRWVNEIQNWGLGKYSKEVRLDVKAIWRQANGGEVDVSLLEDEDT
ncbi:hypothetical protein B0A55_12372 [Friedmanniomyces simplex]|uniref:Uncharacterized protein n=1 Tax=Friedmanniomyces simplex TaxID=329884 RepID=A0A4V5NCX8_9PEZI|nr:hypothetical protein B0A55_12372 [Friedmanniomyces simplex]